MKKLIVFCGVNIHVCIIGYDETVKIANQEIKKSSCFCAQSGFIEHNDDGIRELYILFSKDRDVLFKTIIHEVWHLYMYLLDTLNPLELYSASELCKETYAYSFETLSNTVYKEYLKLNEKYKRRK